MNLPTGFSVYQTWIDTASDVPNENGLLFPYVEELAKPDHETIPGLLRGRLFGLLGDDQEEASLFLKELLKGWSGLSITKWGHELTHIFTGLELMYQTGALMKVLVSEERFYQGFLLSGKDFSVHSNEGSFPCVPHERLVEAFDTVQPHKRAFEEILKMINFADPNQRTLERQNCKTMARLAQLIRTEGYASTHIERLKSLLKYIAFPGDRSLSLNAYNLKRVMSALGGQGLEKDFPLHHIAAFSTDRNHRLLSSFGVMAPSFLIEGGRSMELSGNFSFTKKTAKGKREIAVTKMFAAVKPWDVACRDLDEVIQLKAVKSPIGTALAARASSKSLIRDYEGADGLEILTHLRRIAGVVVTQGSEASSSKRRAEEEADGHRDKRIRERLEL